MTNDDVQRWLDRYVEAWRTYDAAAIGDLFAAGAVYRYHPWDEGDDIVQGRDAIIANWREDQDDPGSWTARYEPYAVGGDRAVAVGQSRYTNADGSLRDLYHNAFLLRFDADGRCAEFTEFFMSQPKAGES